MSEDLTKAYLVQLKTDFTAYGAPENSPKYVAVQFNPETLSLSYSNTIKTPNNAGGGDKASSTAMQYVGCGKTTLSFELVFDVNRPDADVDDARELTQDVLYFFVPQALEKGALPVRFGYGTFIFDGVMSSLKETLELFSADGRALRATMSVTLQKQVVEAAQVHRDGRGEGSAVGGRVPPGVTPFARAPVQGRLDDLLGPAAGDWKAVGEGNGLEQPWRLDAAQLINLGAGRRR